MATVIQRKDGKKVVLLNPSEKGTRFARQLKSGVNHAGVSLTETQKAWRSGYLSAQSDSAKAYKSRLKKK